MMLRPTIAIMLPIGALALQWVLWPWLSPYAWLLFLPMVFFSARIGGFWWGLFSTVLSVGIVWFFFLPPQLSWKINDPPNLCSVVLFLVMGYLFSDSQERLLRSQRNMKDALADTKAANEKLTQLYARTLELDELKTQFFANVSHELRTPLTLIMSPLTQRLSASDLSSSERRESEMMLRNARILYRHVSDLLDVAKLESGRMVVHYARFDIGALMRTTAAQFEEVARHKAIDFQIDAPSHLEMEADGEMLERALINLLSNAFKFTPRGGRIAVSLRQKGDKAEITMADNGPGVPAEMREAVFERFRQVEGDDRRRFGGTGLGLAITKEFAELHGGEVSLSETPGGGATFTIRLPLRAPAGTSLQTVPSHLDPIIDREALENLASPPQMPDEPSPAGGDAPLVLVVEDNLDMNYFIADSLRPAYRVVSAYDGMEGMEKALACKPDIILSDVMMPRLSGDMMVDRLRQQTGMEDVPIIMLTAKADDELRVRLLKQGVHDYIDKPFTVEVLLARVESLIRESRKIRDALLSREISYRSLFENMINGYAHYQMLFENGEPVDFVYLDVNNAFEEQTGLRDVVGRKVSEVIPGIRESDSELFQILGGIARGGAPKRFEVYIQALQMWFAISAYSPEKEHFVTILDVITERKKAEENIRLLNADLERRVSERTAELSAANNELASFAYAVSHDLRAPLRALSGFSQALIEDYGGSLTGEAKIYLDQIDITSHRMGELIDGILTLSRVTRGELRRETIDISALATRLLEELARGETGRQVRSEIETGLQVIGDPSMVEAVMSNLLGNAWKYTGKTENPVIRVSSGEVDGQPGIRVADNGAGFDMAHVNSLFEPFRRLHRQDEFPGIGIGLATVYRIVHRHGGQIRAEGRLNEGASFCFTLPGDIPEETT